MKNCTSLWPLLLLFVPTACTPADQIHRGAGAPLISANQPATASNPAPAAVVHGVTYVNPWEILGQWQLVAVTGAEVSPPSPVEMLIYDSRVEARSRCVQFYFDGPFGQVAGARPNSGSPGCQQGLTPVEAAFVKVMRTTRLLQPRPGGRVAFVGNDGEALFERPKAASEVYDNNPLLMWGEWRVRGITVGGQEAPGAGFTQILVTTSLFEVNPNTCGGWASYYNQDGDRLTFHGGFSIRGCERDDGSEEDPISKILRGGVKIEQSSPSERLLVGNAGSIRLVRCAQTDETVCYVPLGR